MMEAVIASAVRTPVGKAPRGALCRTRPDEMAAVVIREAIARVQGLEDEEVEDVILGCAFPEAEQGMNVARIASLRAGLPYSTCAMTINRFCSSGLQAIASAAEKIAAGFAQVIVAGGTESMSLVPMAGTKFSPNPHLVDAAPDTYISMGLAGERVAKEFGISREAADEFALRSHTNALSAVQAEKFKDEIVPLKVQIQPVGPEGSHLSAEEVDFSLDEGPRADTSLERLATLKPVFHARGTVTAGNASQTSDGAAACVVMSAARAKELGVRPLARFLSFATGGVAPELMGIGPVVAIPKALKYAGLQLSDIDIIELNEAFAAQALAVIQEARLDIGKVNVNGGAVALGHPLGCTGAKLTATLLHEMRRRKCRYGMVTMCIGGGMGAAGVFQIF